MYNNNQTLKTLFSFYIPDSEIDGGLFINDTDIYKKIHELSKDFQPANKESIESYCFNLTIKMMAIELNQGDNHGLFCADSCMYLFENSIQDVNIEEQVGFCCYYRILNNFNENQTMYDDEALLINDTKTKETISYDSINNLVLRIISSNLNIQTSIVIMNLLSKENKNIMISLLAASEKEEHIRSASRLFNQVVCL